MNVWGLNVFHWVLAQSLVELCAGLQMAVAAVGGVDDQESLLPPLEQAKVDEGEPGHGDEGTDAEEEKVEVEEEERGEEKEEGVEVKADRTGGAPSAEPVITDMASTPPVSLPSITPPNRQSSTSGSGSGTGVTGVRMRHRKLPARAEQSPPPPSGESWAQMVSYPVSTASEPVPRPEGLRVGSYGVENLVGPWGPAGGVMSDGGGVGRVGSK